MQTLTINVNNNNFDKVMNFLKNKNVEIIEHKKIEELEIEPISEDDPDYKYIVEGKKELGFLMRVDIDEKALRDLIKIYRVLHRRESYK